MALSKTSFGSSLPSNNWPTFLMDKTHKWLVDLLSSWRVYFLLSCLLHIKLKNPFPFLYPNSTTIAFMLVLLVFWGSHRNHLCGYHLSHILWDINWDHWNNNPLNQYLNSSNSVIYPAYINNLSYPFLSQENSCSWGLFISYPEQIILNCFCTNYPNWISLNQVFCTQQMYAELCSNISPDLPLCKQKITTNSFTSIFKEIWPQLLVLIRSCYFYEHLK